MKLKKMTLRGVFILLLASLSPNVSGADGQSPDLVEAADNVSTSPVVIYGQSLNPQSVDTKTPITWDSVKDLMPLLLSDAQSSTKTPEALCDHIVELSKLYLINLEKTNDSLMGKLAQSGKVDLTDGEMDGYVLQKLTVQDESGLDELIKTLPDEEVALRGARILVLQNLMLGMLHDAALEGCPAYAKEKYTPYYSYSGPDAGYVPEGAEEKPTAVPSP